jgi:DNA-directed RNA polymerase subunit RPC12/RpoP
MTILPTQHLEATANMNTTGHHATADDSLRYVFIERPRCPACGSAELQTIRSKSDKSDGSKARRTACRDCGHRFFVIVE